MTAAAELPPPPPSSRRMDRSSAREATPVEGGLSILSGLHEGSRSRGFGREPLLHPLGRAFQGLRDVPEHVHAAPPRLRPSGGNEAGQLFRLHTVHLGLQDSVDKEHRAADLVGDVEDAHVRFRPSSL